MINLKLILKVNILLCLLMTFSCNSKKENVSKKEIYYKIYSNKNDLMCYALRKYEYNKDTIEEKYLLIDSKGEIKNSYREAFLKKNAEIFIFSKVKDDDNKYLYFLPTKKDTCFHITRMLDSFYLCSQGKVNFKEYKDVYKVYYDERGYDTKAETLILNKDYTILARLEDSNDYRKEIIAKDDEIDEKIKSQFEEAIKKIEWW